VLMRTEAATQQKLKTDTGVWVEEFATGPRPQHEGQPGQPAPATPAAATGAPANTPNQISTFSLTCRAVDLQNVASDANNSIFVALESELKNSPILDPKQTGLAPEITPEDATHTFKVSATLVAKQPLNL